MAILQKNIFGEVFEIGKFDTLKSHIKGNLKVQNSKETIISAIIQVLPYVGFPNGISALVAAKEVFSEVKND